MEKTIEIPEGYKARIEGDKVILENNESEDERIRKTLLRCCDDWDKGQYGTMAKKDVAKIRAYLEKQKGQKPAEWKPQPESLEALMYAIEGKWSTIPPTSYLSRRLEDLYEGLVNTFNVDEKYLNRLSETEYTEKDKDAIKPTPKQDYSGLTDLERAIHRGFLCAGVENVSVGIIKDTAQDCLAQIKPEEWSEYDKEILERTIIDIEALREQVYGKSLCDEEIDWLKNLPERFGLQPKQEWSEEDEMRINHLIGFVEKYGLNYYASTDKVLSWLKSLRPQPKQESEPIEIKYAGKIYKVYGTKELPGGIVGYIIEDEPGHYDCIIHPDEVLGGGYGVKSNGSPYPTKDITFDEKPTEWSEEDNEKIGRLRSIVNEYACRKGALDVNGDYCEGDYEKLDNWLKDLSNRFALQPKQEWSEVEQNVIDCAVDVLEKELPSLAASLKSFRPQPHWKPSEEQMGALNYAYCELFKRGDVKHNILGSLQNLIDTLRNL